jgi:hypothetical protein
MTNLFRSRTTRLALPIVGLLLFYVTGVIVRQQYGIGVVVRNESGETLRQVSLKVESIGDRGKRYNLRDLLSGGHVRVYAQPVTESHINLEFMDVRSKLHTETVVGYAEAGYCGNAKATILPGGKTKLTEDIDAVFCGKSWLDFISVTTPTLSPDPGI